MQNYVIQLRSRTGSGTDERHAARLAEARVQRFMDKLDALLADPVWAGHVSPRRCACPEHSMVILTCSIAAARRIAQFSNVRSVTCQMLDAA